MWARIFLLASLAAGCSEYGYLAIGGGQAGGPTEGAGGDTGAGAGGGAGVPPLDPVEAEAAGANGEPCDVAAQVPGWLDQFQVAGDNRVLYCHAPHGSNPVLVESAVSSCEAHLSHAQDLFPSTGCDS